MADNRQGSDETLAADEESSEADRARLRYDQGVDDGSHGRPPCMVDLEYIRGYHDGRRKRRIIW
jgi:hypothetical protein